MQTSIPQRLLGSWAVISVLAVTALASSASASIVVGQSIAGIKLGASQAQVTAVLGAPTLQQAPDTKGSVEWNYAKQPLLGAISFAAGGELDSMWTSSKRQKTNKGVGPGSSLVQVRKAYPKAKCSTGPFGPKSVICVLKSKANGRAVETSFLFFTRSVAAREVDIYFA
jgi:hypothetical protein